MTHCHRVNSSQLLWEPNRLPLPEEPVPPNGAYASLFRVWAFRHRSVAVLAARWGFVDAAHFSRMFRQNYGYSPS